MSTRPRIVVLCGSTRFWPELAEENLRQTAAGRIVLAPGCDMKRPHPLWADPADAEALKPVLDDLHKRKIDLADEVLVLNVGGYIGASTRSEIEYAEQLGKPITYLVGGDQPLDLSYPAILTRTADRIELYGLAVDDYTVPVEGVDPAEWPADLQGNIAAACGYPPATWEAETADSAGFRPARKVCDLLVDRLALDPDKAWDESLGGWSDEHTAEHVVVMLREIAAEVAQGGGEAA